MNYIQFRIQIAPVIAYIIIPPGLLTSFLLSVNVTYYLIGTIIIGRKGSSDVKDYSMGSITKKVLDGASDMAVCVVL